MTSKRHALPGCIEAAVPLAMLAAALLAASSLSAGAGELKVPPAKPEVIMDIPDGWAIEPSKSGFEMRAPEKNSIVVGRTMGRDRKALDKFRDEAAEKLKAFGISFDPNAKAPPKPAEPPKPETKSDNGTSAFTTSPDKFTFSGAPSLKDPGEKDSNNPVKPAQNSIQNLTGLGLPAAPKMPKLPFRAVQIYGAALDGKPVDVQLVIYNLPANRLFVMMQESGSDDGRAVAMAQSVRGVEAPADASDSEPKDAKKDVKAKDGKKGAKSRAAKSQDDD